MPLPAPQRHPRAGPIRTISGRGRFLTETELLRLVRELLEQQTTVVLATADGAGKPSAAPLYYWSDAALNLYWYSAPDSRHSRYLEARPACSAAVFAPVTDWTGIRGVQMDGTASRLDGGGPVEDYIRKFNLPDKLRPTILSSAAYVFRPDWIRYLDNAFGFGFKQEINVRLR